MNNLLIRTITGIALVVVMMGCVFIHPLTFGLLGLVIVSGSYLELKNITLEKTPRVLVFAGLAFSGLAYIISFLVASGTISEVYLVLLLLIIPMLAVAGIYNTGSESFVTIAKLIFSILFVTTPYILMLFASFSFAGSRALLGHSFEIYNPAIVAGFFILLWINDSAAYLVGASIGKHRLFERISPKKSWEGFFGGLVFTLGAAWLISGFFTFLSRPDWIIIGGIITVGATYGDLFESLLKRNAGIKDSGNILPGHGGFLDRFDGLSFAFPLVFLYITFFG
ncbi:MAG: phosphatidate cytidylyltransferase [Marinilabiliaceae bacterium]|nr:phosphatidate cytidylyltransferase [Marinilabiliaceae bacterium]